MLKFLCCPLVDGSISNIKIPLFFNKIRLKKDISNNLNVSQEFVLLFIGGATSTGISLYLVHLIRVFNPSLMLTIDSRVFLTCYKVCSI